MTAADGKKRLTDVAEPLSPLKKQVITSYPIKMSRIKNVQSFGCTLFCPHFSKLPFSQKNSNLQQKVTHPTPIFVAEIRNFNYRRHLLTEMLSFAVYEKMLLLFKKVCRTYLYTYPEVVWFYILEYKKEYDRESLKGTEYEYLLDEDKEWYD